VTAKLCVLVVALAVIARTRVAILPGWVVPLPVLIVAAELGVCAVLAAWLICQARRPAPRPLADAGGIP